MKLIMHIGRRGIVNGLLIGFVKIIGETAPVIFLTSSTANLYLQSFTTSVIEIPVLIYAFAFSNYPNSNDVAWGSSELITIVTIMFMMARKTTT